MSEWLTKPIEALNDGPVCEEQHNGLNTRWGTALAGRLQRLAQYSSLGLLSHADERRFQSVCEELRTLSDLIDRFELTQPDFTDRT
jgi:hypothetical protein